jgi:CheY-like chemotaxis protein/anti-sigma regulatory factor (Ser/Thr protein kinase)
VNSSHSPNPAGLKRILIVDDDATARLLITHHLKKTGYEIVTADGVPQAKAIIATPEQTPFDAIVTDYLMPGATGLELLEWIKQRDPTVAAIIVTAVGERNLVKESLRGGACDFLDKPVQISALLDSVAAAVDRTCRQRQLQEAESSVQEVGKFQQFMLGMSPANLPAPIDICWHPRHAAGGDLVNIFQLSSQRLLVVVADVSGHDLKAGFISAFFQGIVRGMVAKGTPIEETFDYFNRFLVNEWSSAQNQSLSRFDVAASISVCAFVVDLASQQLAVWNSGFPVPICIDSDGRAERCGDAAGYPLGWFEENSLTAFHRSIGNGGFVYAWTDGLEDLAGQRGVSPISLADQLLQARKAGISLPFLQDCADDILLVRINLAATEDPNSLFRPLIYEQYFDRREVPIDHLQAKWEKSIESVLPALPKAKMFDLLLCSREAVINGIKYGCGAVPLSPCSYQVNYRPDDHTLRVVVDDPGPGHNFDWAEYEKAAAEQLLDAHRGLMLIHRLPDATRIERRGASITMDFKFLQP